MLKKPNKKAFTIVELVIVFAVIAILMGILFVGGTAINNNAKKSTMESDFRNYEIALKSVVNDPENKSLLVTDATSGVDIAAVKTAMDAYFEDDMAINGAFGANDANAKANRKAYEATTKLKDPYGMPYHVVVLDDSTTEHTDISLIVYSFGKNKQTADGAATSKWDKDDVVRVIRVVDSVIYTYDFGPGLAADTEYQQAANDAFTNKPAGFTPAIGA